MLQKLKWRLNGETYRNKYRVKGELFRSAFSTIYEAEERKDKRSITLKILNNRGEKVARKLLQDPHTMWEGALLKILNHPNIVKGYDCCSGKKFWVAMETLDTSLFSYLKNSDEMPDEPYLIGIFHDIACAINYLHQKGLIHRDIAPDNIMIKDGRAKLIDLGMTIPVGSKVAKGRVGTPSYMSPEIIRNPSAANSNTESDIYAFGVVMYELVTGEKLFRGKSKEERMTRVLNETPPPLSQAASGKGCCEPLEELIMSCLAKKPQNRPENAEEVARALQTMCRMESVGKPYSASA